jgi:hypothetical protein
MLKKEKLFSHRNQSKLVIITISSITEISKQSIVKDQTKLQFWEQHWTKFQIRTQIDARTTESSDQSINLGLQEELTVSVIDGNAILAKSSLIEKGAELQITVKSQSRGTNLPSATSNADHKN